MKMSQTMYEEIAKDIKSVAKQMNVIPTTMGTMFNLLHVVNVNHCATDDDYRFKKGLWTRYLPYDGRSMSWMYQQDHDLNDSHIETALKKIQQEIIKEGLN